MDVLKTKRKWPDAKSIFSICAAEDIVLQTNWQSLYHLTKEKNIYPGILLLILFLIAGQKYSEL